MNETGQSSPNLVDTEFRLRIERLEKYLDTRLDKVSLRISELMDDKTADNALLRNLHDTLGKLVNRVMALESKSPGSVAPDPLARMKLKIVEGTIRSSNNRENGFVIWNAAINNRWAKVLVGNEQQEVIGEVEYAKILRAIVDCWNTYGTEFCAKKAVQPAPNSSPQKIGADTEGMNDDED